MYKKLHVFNFCIGMRIEKKVHRENKPMRDNIVFVSPNQSPKRILNMIYCVQSLPWSLYADFFFNCWKTNKKTTTLNQKWWRNTYIYRHNNDTWLTRFFWWVFFFTNGWLHYKTLFRHWFQSNEKKNQFTSKPASQHNAVNDVVFSIAFQIATQKNKKKAKIRQANKKLFTFLH